jgi:hypothetical protein
MAALFSRESLKPTLIGKHESKKTIRRIFARENHESNSAA